MKIYSHISILFKILYELLCLHVFLLSRMKGSRLGWTCSHHLTQVARGYWDVGMQWSGFCIRGSVTCLKLSVPALFTSALLLQSYSCTSLCLLHETKWRTESCSFCLPSHNFSLFTITLLSYFLSFDNYLGKWKANQNMLIQYMMTE